MRRYLFTVLLPLGRSAATLADILSSTSCATSALAVSTVVFGRNLVKPSILYDSCCCFQDWTCCRLLHLSIPTLRSSLLLNIIADVATRFLNPQRPLNFAIRFILLASMRRRTSFHFLLSSPIHRFNAPPSPEPLSMTGCFRRRERCFARVRFCSTAASCARVETFIGKALLSSARIRFKTRTSARRRRTTLMRYRMRFLLRAE